MKEYPICQCCGMELREETDCGTEQTGEKTTQYCKYCYENGAFTNDLTMEEQVERNLRFLEEWNEGSRTNYTREEARQMLLQYLPTLRRWNP